MDLYTSISNDELSICVKEKIKSARTTLLILCPLLALLLGGLGAWVYMNWWNPSVAFQRLVVAEKFRALDRSKDFEERVLVVGGSSVSFSIQPELLKEEFGLDVVNLGLPAGAGRGLHCEWALQEMREGDFIVLAFESTGWTSGEENLVTPLGSQFWYLTMKSRYDKSMLENISSSERYQWKDLRPGGEHIFTLAAKIAFKQPLYRYNKNFIRKGGYLVGPENWDIKPSSSVVELELAPMQRDLLVSMKKLVEAKGAHLVISIPWILTKDENLPEQRRQVQELISELEVFAPVLVDPMQGSCGEIDWFADTRWHLTEEGARERSRAFGKGLLSLDIR